MFLTTLIQHCTGDFRKGSQARKRNTRHPYQKVKLFLAAEDMILHKKILKNLLKKLSELINKFNKISG